MLDSSTPENGNAIAHDEWPEPATSPTYPIGSGKDPRKVVCRELIDWLAVHVTGVHIGVLHEAADKALDHIEDAMAEDGGDWSLPW